VNFWVPQREFLRFQEISAEVCVISQTRQGSANSNPKFRDKKLAKACDKKILRPGHSGWAIGVWIAARGPTFYAREPTYYAHGQGLNGHAYSSHLG
jgi:hypothetical protein